MSDEDARALTAFLMTLEGLRQTGGEEMKRYLRTLFVLSVTLVVTGCNRSRERPLR